jgi:hypothetical protein
LHERKKFNSLRSLESVVNMLTIEELRKQLAVTQLALADSLKEGNMSECFRLMSAISCLKDCLIEALGAQNDFRKAG